MYQARVDRSKLCRNSSRRRSRSPSCRGGLKKKSQSMATSRNFPTWNSLIINSRKVDAAEWKQNKTKLDETFQGVLKWNNNQETGCYLASQNKYLFFRRTLQQRKRPFSRFLVPFFVLSRTFLPIQKAVPICAASAARRRPRPTQNRQLTRSHPFCLVKSCPLSKKSRMYAERTKLLNPHMMK
jgi:hypothetical protein